MRHAFAPAAYALGQGDFFSAEISDPSHMQRPRKRAPEIYRVHILHRNGLPPEPEVESIAQALYLGPWQKDSSNQLGTFGSGSSHSFVRVGEAHIYGMLNMTWSSQRVDD